jgi:cytochrome c-type biogenesis protein
VQALLAEWVDQIGPLPLVAGLAVLVGTGILLARWRIRRRSRVSSEDTSA